MLIWSIRASDRECSFSRVVPLYEIVVKLQHTTNAKSSLTLMLSFSHNTIQSVACTGVTPFNTSLFCADSLTLFHPHKSKFLLCLFFVLFF